MVIIHAVQKLLNISRLQPALFITASAIGQEMHSWYAKLISTPNRGKFLVMFVHEPSLLIVLAKGKTITGTLPAFYERLEALLKRNNFEPGFIQREVKMIREGYIISKTNNRSVVASMNAITENIETSETIFESYDTIDLNLFEDLYLGWLTRDNTSSGKFKRTCDYWQLKGLMQ